MLAESFSLHSQSVSVKNMFVLQLLHLFRSADKW
jgi:hypothetical protein